MSSNTAYAFISVTLVSGLSLLGVIGLALSPIQLTRLVPLLISLAVGALYGDALLHLVPESFAAAPSLFLNSVYILCGVFGSLGFEYLLAKRKESLRHLQIRPTAFVNLFSSSTHNFVDGALIGTAFLSGRALGLATTFAVVLHEIPHELGDFGILVHSGLRPRQAILLNFISALVALLGLLTSMILGGELHSYSIIMLPVTCGAFLYLAGTALMPELLKVSSPEDEKWKWGALACGVGMMLLLKWV